MNNTPHVSPELITYLERQYPLDKVTSIKTEGELKHLQGQLSVVHHLRTLLEWQTKNGNILNV